MISGAKVSALCHLSENPEKVEIAFLNVLPPSLREKFYREEIVGHFGKIISFSKQLSKSKARKLAAYLAEKLPKADKKILSGEIAERLNGSTLFFKLDKGKALEGELALTGGSDAILVSITIATFPRDEKKIVGELRGIFA